MGCPLFHFSCGFLSNTILAMLPSSPLSVCPIHLQDLFFISASMGSCPVCCHKSSFLIFSGHLMPRMRRKHLLTNTWILFINIAVSLQVSDPYNNTDLTFEEKILSFVFNDMEVVCHTGLSNMNACLALLMRALMSSHVPPVLLIILPRY